MMTWLIHPMIGTVLVAMPVLAKEPSQSDLVASAPGRVEGAADVMPIGTAATGVISDVLVKEGDPVKKGQVLVHINCSAIEAEVRQREAELAAADAALHRLKSGARDEEIAIAIAIVAVSQARAEEAEKAFQRLSTLQEGVASRARMFETERDFKMAAAQLLESRQRLRMLQAGARGEDVRESEAKQGSAMAALDQARVRLDQCTVRAPADGRVFVIYVTPGQFIASTAPTVLLKMVDDSILRVRAEVDERDLQKVCPDQRARVTADGFKGVTLAAKVIRINPGMGRRTILTGDKAEKADRDVRELLLTLESVEARWPIGLRVLVFFLKC
jgi:multidrug resistance efflux pump